MRVTCWIPLLMLLALGTARAGTKLVTFKAVADGKPVAGATASTYWSVRGGKLQAYGKATTDAEGRGKLRVRWYNRPTALTVFDAERKTGGFVVLTRENIDATVTVNLSELVSVSGKLTCSKMPKALTYATTSLQARAGRSAPTVLRVTSSSTIQAKLPPGDYRLWVYAGQDAKGTTRNFTVPSGKERYDLGTIDLQPSIIAQHYGKTPPAWTVTDARGAAKTVGLGDYEGKWLLIEFWGYW